MTFDNFQSFVEFSDKSEHINIEADGSTENNQAVITDLYDTSGMVVCEVLVWVYDSGFHFGPMSSEIANGSIIISEE